MNRHRRELAIRRAIMAHPRDRKPDEAMRRAQVKNPLYSRALDRTAVNDGNQGKTQQGMSINHAGGMALPYSTLGPGIP
jgi:hypothetical protein